MKFAYCSDLHLEFYDQAPNWSFMNNTENADVLILAGDIVMVESIIRFPYGSEYVKSPYYNHTKVYESFFDYISKQYENIVVVMGNHEYYKAQYHKVFDHYQQYLKNFSNNVHLLDNSSITLNSIKIVGSTLWTDLNNCNPMTIYDVGTRMNDYRNITIKHGGNYTKLEPMDTFKFFRDGYDFIFGKNSDADIVVTHHAPSLLSINEKYKNSFLNHAYYSDLSNDLLDYGKSVWIHGHVHDPVEYIMGEVDVRCNPKGYPNERSNFEIKYFEL